MSEKRKDHKGRILRTGESQRKDLLYQYRYTDNRGKRRTIYDSGLNSLREQVKKIQKHLDDDMDYAAGEVTVIELLERYISLKQGVRYNTRTGYDFALKLIKKEDFGYRKIRGIKVSDAQLWMMKLREDGRRYSTLARIRGIAKPAFQLACDEDAIRKNPFGFKLSNVVANDSQKRIAMTHEQQHTWMSFVKNDKTYSEYYDEFVVLLGTGLRVSEFCGLTKSSIDFENRKIRIDHQLCRESGGKYYAEKTKTKCGIRFIPMTDAVYQSLKSIIANRRKVKTEIIVDGYGGFLFLDKNGRPKIAHHYESMMRYATKKYRKLHPDAPLPRITPHVFRHTFCTNMANSGMDIKTLQYVMGHSNISLTLDVYTHINYDRVADEMAKIVDLKPILVQIDV